MALNLLDKQHLDFGRSLPNSAIPGHLRCGTCKKLALDAFKTRCCAGVICRDCDNSITASECPLCERSPFGLHERVADRVLRTTVKVFIKSEALKRNVDLKGDQEPGGFQTVGTNFNSSRMQRTPDLHASQALANYILSRMPGPLRITLPLERLGSNSLFEAPPPPTPPAILTPQLLPRLQHLRADLIQARIVELGWEDERGAAVLARLIAGWVSTGISAETIRRVIGEGLLQIGAGHPTVREFTSWLFNSDDLIFETDRNSLYIFQDYDDDDDEDDDEDDMYFDILHGLLQVEMGRHHALHCDDGPRVGPARGAHTGPISYSSRIKFVTKLEFDECPGVGIVATKTMSLSELQDRFVELAESRLFQLLPGIKARINNQIRRCRKALGIKLPYVMGHRFSYGREGGAVIDDVLLKWSDGRAATPFRETSGVLNLWVLRETAPVDSEELLEAERQALLSLATDIDNSTRYARKAAAVPRFHEAIFRYVQMNPIYLFIIDLREVAPGVYLPRWYDGRERKASTFLKELGMNMNEAEGNTDKRSRRGKGVKTVCMEKTIS